MNSEDCEAKPYRSPLLTGLPIRNAKIPEGFGLDTKLVAAADHYTTSYLALAPHLEYREIENISVLTGEFIMEFSRDFPPGSVVRRIGLVPIAFSDDGVTFCVHVTTGDVYYVSTDWTDERDPDYFQGGHDTDVDKHWTRAPLTIEELKRRDALLFPTLVHFFTYLDRIRYDVPNGS